MELLWRCRDDYPRRLGFLAAWMLSGLRWGEAVALCREDIDFRQGILWAGWTWDGEKVGPAKGGRRWTPAPPPLLDILAQHFASVDAEAKANGWDLRIQRGTTYGTLAFPNKNGRLDTSSGGFYDHFWKPLLAGANLAYRNFHCTRHTFATWSLNEPGRDAREVQGWLGHATLEQTIGAYSHCRIAQGAISHGQAMSAIVGKLALGP